MTERTKWAMLTGSTLVWLGLLAFQMITDPEPPRVPLTYKSGPTTQQDANQRLTRKQAKLTQAQHLSFAPPKNIFAPLSRQEASSNRNELRPPTSAQKKTSPRVAKPLPSAVQPERAQPPLSSTPPPTPTLSATQQAAQKASQQLAQYRFLGYVVRRDTTLAFLEKEHKVYIVKIGDRVDGNIEVKTIDPAQVTLVDGPTAVEATIPLTPASARASQPQAIS